jgi:hypothetical protein
MRRLWREESRLLAWWWSLLTLASIGNIALWCLLYHHFYRVPTGSLRSPSQTELMLLLCAAYVFGCAFRAILPRADVQRICLFDTWLSSVVIGRSVATVAEISFAAQWVIVLRQLGGIAGVDTALGIATVVVPLIVVAQCCSWYGVLTTNYLANAIENSLWAVTFLSIGVALCLLLPEFEGVVRFGLIVAIIGIAGYLAFLATIDVPMYLSRWYDSRVAGSEVLYPIQGLRDASTRRIVTHDFAKWRDEIAWMSLYFTAGVWGSLALCLVCGLQDYVPRFRDDPTRPTLGAQVHHEKPDVGRLRTASAPGDQMLGGAPGRISPTDSLRTRQGMA